MTDSLMTDSITTVRNVAPWQQQLPIWIESWCPDFRLPQRCKWDLQSSGLLRSVKCRWVADFPEYPIVSIFMGLLPALFDPW